MIGARGDPSVKLDAETVFTRLGLTATEAITLFYTRVTLQSGLPFAVRAPNADTEEALRQATAGEDLVEHGDLDELKARFR